MYKLQQNSIKRLSDGASIPFADGNIDYEEYKQWLLEGNTPEPEFTAEELAVNTQNELIAHFKSLYLGVIYTKLKELDYDSLATVKLWTDDATFGTEAMRIINWYKAIIAKNYQLMTDVQRTTNPLPIPTDAEYLAMIEAIVF